ncbi:MAG TPA: glycosyltransferase, partial [Ktedonobacterales bacterium]|nr:glycosyltransferase [Ktedonobacterales bacterium]
MKILVVARHLPQPTWGAGTRNYYLLRALARRHTVSVLALAEESEREAQSAPLADYARSVRRVALPIAGSSRSRRLEQIRALVTGRSYSLSAHMLPAMQAALDDELARGHYDVVLFESLLMAGYRTPAHIRTVVDEHNIEHELLWRSYQHTAGLARRGFNWLEYRRVKPLEIAWCRRAHLTLVTSERERHIFQALLPENAIRVVPNGVDIQTFAPDERTAEIAGRIVFTGSFDYYPNIQGALWFAEQCWSAIRRVIPQASWYLVGRNPSPEILRLGELPGVTVTGSVPTVQPYLAAAQVVIAPLLTGGGTRLKIMEAMAMSRPLVTTAQGCEGIDCVSNRHLLVADDPTTFTDAVVALLGDRERRETLGAAGRALVEDRYSWDRCGDDLLTALDEMA